MVVPTKLCRRNPLRNKSGTFVEVTGFFIPTPYY